MNLGRNFVIRKTLWLLRFRLLRTSGLKVIAMFVWTDLHALQPCPCSCVLVVLCSVDHPSRSQKAICKFLIASAIAWLRSVWWFWLPVGTQTHSRHASLGISLTDLVLYNWSHSQRMPLNVDMDIYFNQIFSDFKVLAWLFNLELNFHRFHEQHKHYEIIGNAAAGRTDGVTANVSLVGL